MSKNIEININTGNDTYEALYPKASYQNMVDTLSILSTVGNLPLNRLAEKVSTADVVSGSYVGDKGYIQPMSDYNMIQNTTAIVFNGKNTVPDLLLIVENNLGDNFGIFTNFKGESYRFGIGIEVNEGFSLNSTKITNFGVIGWLMNGTREVYDSDYNDIPVISNKIYIGIYSTNYSGYQTEATSAWTLSNNGTYYTYYGFYFS